MSTSSPSSPEQSEAATPAGPTPPGPTPPEPTTAGTAAAASAMPEAGDTQEPGATPEPGATQEAGATPEPGATPSTELHALLTHRLYASASIRRLPRPVRATFAWLGRVIVRREFSWTGLLSALGGFAAAMTPSLLPRPALYLAVIAGVGTAVGYAFGVFLAWVVRKLGISLPRRSVQEWAWLVLFVVSPIIAVWVLILGSAQQNDVRELVGEPREPTAWLAVLIITPLVAYGLIAAGRGLRRLTSRLSRLLDRWLPEQTAAVVSVILVVLISYWVASDVLFRSVIHVADSVYSGTNDTTTPGVVQVTSDLRSGSKDSLISWDSLGRTGRDFVAGGPSVDDIAQVTGSDAIEPIRVYVGLETADTARERAALAVKELERTGAFDRKVLVVAGATGTGWTEPQQVAALEYLWGGDTAIVTQQYSYLPSWISFLVDADRAADAGRELFDAVHEKWASLPADSRPKLISYGLSLGSFSAQAPFASVGDISARVDGALYVGTPNFTPLSGTITATRDDGSPQWRPVIRDGRFVRYASSPAQLSLPTATWEQPRVVYLQHASDPVVWWSWDLLTQEPDWLTEQRGPDVSADTHWFPVVTFVQVTVDQFFGISVPDGHGHNYASQIVGAWAAVTQPPGWTDDRLADLQATINTTLSNPPDVNAG